MDHDDELLKDDLIGGVDRPLDPATAARILRDQEQQGRAFEARMASEQQAEPGDVHEALERLAWGLPEPFISRSEVRARSEGTPTFEKLAKRAAAQGDDVSPVVATALRYRAALQKGEGGPIWNRLVELAAHAAEHLDDDTVELLNKALDAMDVEAVVVFVTAAYAPELLSA
jgi:hypothetical protein